MIAPAPTRPIKPTGARALKLAVALILAFVVAAPLAACGKRGDPEHPGREAPKYPRTYPDPVTYPPS